MLDYQTLSHALTDEKEVYPAFTANTELMNCKWLENKIAYVALNSFDSPKIDSLFISKLPELYNAKGIIIDVRFE